MRLSLSLCYCRTVKISISDKKLQIYNIKKEHCVFMSFGTLQEEIAFKSSTKPYNHSL